eukprot:9222303-Alexandrium_andersonii.AAC.1
MQRTACTASCRAWDHRAANAEDEHGQQLQTLADGHHPARGVELTGKETGHGLVIHENVPATDAHHSARMAQAAT